MRFLLQTFALLIIVKMGWEQPYRDVVASVCPWADITPSRLSTMKTRAAPPPSAVDPDDAPPPPVARRNPLESTSSLNRPAKH